MTKFKQLVNPHSHSDGSLDGASTVKDIIKRNIELGTKYVAITEHGNMNTAMDLYHTCKKMGAKPILGIELYLQNPFMEVKEQKWRSVLESEGKTTASKLEAKIEKKLQSEYVHLTVHFKDEWAYNYFCKLSPIMDQRAVVKFGERKPVCTIDELRGAAGHITICSGCLVGIVQGWLLPDRQTGEVRPDLAEKAYATVREIAGKDDFFVEIFPHGVTSNWMAPKREKGSNKIIEPGYFKPNECTPWFPNGDWQEKANRFVLDLTKKYNDKAIISLDSHFANPEDKIIQDSRLGNGKEAWKFHTSYHLYSTDEAADHLKRTLDLTDRDIEELVDNSYMFASRFDDFKLLTSDDRWVMQPLDPNWQSQLKEKIDFYGRMNWSLPEMTDRLKHEIKILAYNKRLNLMPYFFTVEDIANFCKREGILMTVRGSAAGSLLLYLLGVSAVNPLAHGLSFERFLTEGRIDSNSLPDTDMDFSDKERVIAYLEEKFGDNICKISIDSMLKLKSSIKDAERSITGEVSKATEDLCKKLPHSPQGADESRIIFGYEDDSGLHVPGLIDTHKELKAWAIQNPKIWETAYAMLGIQRQKSVHACGVVITDKPVQEYCPVITVGGHRATGYGPKAVETAGLIKFDLLGVKTLGDIEKALKSIKNRSGVELDPWNLPKDENVMAAFGLGNTESVFQFDTATVVPYLMAICPKDIDDLSAITALCRPGTLDAPYGDGRTLSQVFVDRCNGEPIKYIHQDLEPILKETMGIQLYQEQTIKIFKLLVGYSDEQAETVRRGIGKKVVAVLNACMGDLKTALLARGWVDSQIDLLIEQIMASSNYSFNKSHATAYAYVAYACMYLKEMYPLDWWKSVLSNAKKDEISSKFWKHVKDIVLLPDISKSREDFVIEGDKVRAPLSIITGIGAKAYAQLVSNAPYATFDDFVTTFCAKRSKEEARNPVHTGIIYRLIYAGVLDSLFENKDLSSIEKAELFERSKAEVREEKQNPIKKEFIGMTRLGEYLVKKELIPIYSEDLRPIILPPRGGYPALHGDWFIQGSDIKVMSGLHISNFISSEMTSGRASCLAYVIDESIISYKNKTRQATKMQVDVDGAFFETILWPEWESETGVANSGFKKTPVVLVYEKRNNRCNLKHVVRLINSGTEEIYSVL